jgi:thiol:disulfide interchange protein DsbC
MMKGIIKTIALAMLCTASVSTLAATDNTPKEAYDDITHSLADLQPITFQAPTEKYKLLVFIDNQCIYCSNVVKNVKQYTDAGLTMSFLTVAPDSIRDSVIEDMGRVWCSTDKVKSLQKAMAGFYRITTRPQPVLTWLRASPRWQKGWASASHHSWW